MLKATVEILRQLDLEQRGSLPESHYVKSRVLYDLVMRYGGIADAEALLPQFLARPDAALLPILQTHGTPDIGRQLFEAFVSEDGVQKFAPAGVLETIGTLGYAEATPILFRIAREGLHHDSRSACLGLLDLDCDTIKDDIRQMLVDIEAGSATFPEFLPALAVKAGVPSLLDLLSRLAERTPVGNVGGIMVGLVAFGPAGVPSFMRYMTEPHREAYDSATASGSISPWRTVHLA